ncbi:EF-hand domain-containing protein [Aureliella helgolandensis]|uniref:EF-hand domain-containing protein n=1 Tax=Aureliella helgolandensis TaxID=2527968 RepID=A0A518G7X2_9BACT|nr:EF-hand domain-containing protein [Aureliella helgolandensis]QDV24679.1 hypothetical protein Q31a_30000 [Aureliella helgolandensis]
MQRTSYAIALTICGLAASTTMAQPPGGGRGLGGPGGPGGSPLEHMAQLFELADANKDGMLTKAELQSAMQAQAGRPMGRGGPGFQGPPPRASQDPLGAAGEYGGPRGPGSPGDEHGGPGGAPPRPGEILPSFVIDSLDLTEQQKARLAALQKTVDKKLASILTAEQKQELENHRPPQHGPGHETGPDAGRDSGRPQRPQ